ncbi:MAG: MBG domain-containing protein, partial [Coriobacteriales bacterium]|nr:MBG domain-containing protein [Coriobacteriales bacterium]
AKEGSKYWGDSGAFGYTISKAQLTGYWEPADDPVEYEYTGEGQGPVYKVSGATNVDGKLTAGDIITEYAKSGTDEWSTDKPTENGDYVARASLAEVDAAANYLFPTTGTTKNFTIKETPEPITPTITASIDDWYEGEEPSQPQVAIEPSDVEFEYTILYKNVAGGTWSKEVPTQAGSYKMSVQTTQTETYNAAEKKVNFKILEKAQVKLGVKIDGWTYGEAANDPVPTVKDVPEGVTVDESTITYQYRAYDEETNTWGDWTDEKPTTPGKYRIKATLPAGEGYGEVSTGGKAEFTIDYATATITIEAKQKHVGETDPELRATVEGEAEGDKLEYYLKRNPGDAVTEEGKGYWINAYADAEFTQLVSIDAANPTVIGNYKVTMVPARFTILPANVKLGVKIDGWTYGEAANDPVPTVKDVPEGVTVDESTITYQYRAYDEETNTWGDWTDEKPTTPGKYRIKATLPAGEGYGEVSTGGKAEFTIDYATATITIEAKQKHVGETDPELRATVEGEAEGDKLEYYLKRNGDDTVTEEGNGYWINAYADAEFTQLVSYQDGEEPTIIGNYKVTQVRARFDVLPKEKTTPDVKVTIDDWYEGDEPNEPKIDGVPEGVAYKVYYKSTEQGAKWSSKPPTAAGSYKIGVRTTETDDYNVAEASADFNILEKQTLTVEIDEEWEYGDTEEHNPTAKLDGEEVTEGVTFGYQAADAEEGAEWSDEQPTEIGKYKVIAKYNDDLESEPAEFEITRKTLSLATDVTVKLSSTSYNYDGSKKTPSATITVNATGEELERKVGYTSEIKDSNGNAQDISKEPTDPGTYTVVVTANEEGKNISGNYLLVDSNDTATYEIKPPVLTLTTSIDDWTYGEDQATPETKLEGEVVTEGVVYSYRAKADDEDPEAEFEYTEGLPTDAGKYELKATYEGKWDTYTATDDFEVKVATATIKIDAKEKDYGEEDPEFTSTVEGLIGEDTIEYTLKRNGGTEPDTYWINAFDSEDNNLYNGGAGTVKGNYLIKVQRAKLL